ncbi:hypothetical protein IW261DRAFT_1598336 [Armillaria novae-zelandiae]|uniref:DUF6533 domain-containing protein n=1 Tax=Armillaria novae-zelandiae TaxID=153914 RepID=A0AA39NJ67_9AGAR|nr:hypothetical protein IW261DRAFT_1598336 [Armillaria novae-zelandiae]
MMIVSRNRMFQYLDIYDVSLCITWMLIFWDYLITLDDEIALFWVSRRSWIKFLFFANRYMGLILRICDMIGEIFRDADTPFSDYRCRCEVDSKDSFCSVSNETSGTLYLTAQLLVIESILLLRVWAIMGKRRWILWTFCGLLACTTTASTILSVYLFQNSGSIATSTGTLIFEVIIFSFAWNHGIGASGDSFLNLIAVDSLSVLCSFPIMAFLDPRLGITIMSITITHMLLRLRKNVLPDTAGPLLQMVELTTFRATANANGAMPLAALEAGEDVIDIRPYPHGN